MSIQLPEEARQGQRLYGADISGGGLSYRFAPLTCIDPIILAEVHVRGVEKDDWLSLSVAINRNDSLLETRSIRNKLRTGGDEWVPMTLCFATNQRILPGDVVTTAVLAATGKREQFIGPASLRIYSRPPDQPAAGR
ncbi:MAG: hypothetical protein IPL52_15470 [Flavobacteriales bacterium]|nr:hypothetical protein [Flavobacteriales bacterium]